MKTHIFRFLFLLLVGGVLTNCAPTMYVQTGGNSGGAALNKSALHYIVPPTATDSQQAKDLYSVVVSAFQNNHIALTAQKKEAAFLVTWGTESESKQRRTVVASNSSPDWNSNLNVNSSSYYGPNGLSATGPQYTSVVQSYRMQNFTINIWKNDSAKTTSTAPIWSGSATAYPQDAKNPTAIINDIVAHYGTTFAGNTEIKTSNP